jgi:hypothetical protein
MGLLALQMQFDQIHQYRLQVLCQAGRSFELPNMIVGSAQ